MKMNKFPSIIIVVIVITTGKAYDSKSFPEDFRFGVATSAYQIEGAWNIDGKGPSIWDDFVHKHSDKIRDHSNADVGPNSYEFFMDDIAAVKYLNMDYYRFSISWTRVLPTGDLSNVNEKGIEYYDNLIRKLLQYGIEPMVTMYHWDLPLPLAKLGGFTNPSIVDYFEAYAKLLFERFGDRVKIWTTFNEPANFCGGDGIGAALPPANYGVGDYQCVHNVLKAHATVYHMYKDSFYERFKGRIGIVLNTPFYYPDNGDTMAADRGLQFSFGRLAHPIFTAKGNYPDVVIQRIAENSKRENRPVSRLPTFSDEWINKIRGSADFLGVNTYTSRYASTPKEPPGNNPSFERDQNISERSDPNWKQAASWWLYSYPKGIGDLLRWIKTEYNNPVVYVTENGWSDGGEIEDSGRIEYLRGYLQEILNVVLNKDCDLRGYLVWTLMDNFEWTAGYQEHFGFYSVNTTSPRKERIPKKSVEFMKTVTTTRQIPIVY